MKYRTVSAVWLVASEVLRSMSDEERQPVIADGYSPHTYQSIQRLAANWKSMLATNADWLPVFLVGPLKLAMAKVCRGVDVMVDEQLRVLPPDAASEMWVAVTEIMRWQDLYIGGTMRTVRQLLKLGVPHEQIANMVGWKMQPSGRGDWVRVQRADETGEELDTVVVADLERAAKRKVIEEWLAEFPAPISGDTPQEVINEALSHDEDIDKTQIAYTANIIEAWSANVEPERFAAAMKIPEDLVNRVYESINAHESVAAGLSPSDALEHVVAIAKGLGLVIRTTKVPLVIERIREAESNGSRQVDEGGGGESGTGSGADGQAGRKQE